MQEDYEDITGNSIEIVSGTPMAGDFYFTKNSALEEETYELKVEDYLTISASTNLGAYWSTRSILQILKQTGTTIPKGYVKDYPKYEVRGFMLDVARKPFTMDFLYEITEQMSWYKLNDFQVHLNDNHIQSPETYIGYRLESDIPNLANTDLYYTKEEFTDFINDSKNIGVAIVPEFDTPGHAAAFTRANPSIARGDEIEYLDVENPEALEFVKTVISEYIDGENPVFPEGTIVHVGTDEYKRGNKEAFRKYQDDILKWIRDDKGITPRVWGSQTENSGVTPITVENVQMNIWNNGYSNPKTMYDLGYDLINTRDGDLYIVPGAGYYSDYINQTKIATTWEPNNIGGTIIPAGDEQMLGATFAVWNDMNSNPPSQHTLRDNGFTEVEIFDRIYAITPTFGAKLWGDINDYSATEINEIAAITEYAPNSNPTHKVESKTDVIVDYSFDKDNAKDFSGNEYDLTNQKNIDYVEGKDNIALQLNGGESYVTTPLKDMGINKTIDFWVKKDATSSDEEQILFESEVGSVKAVQKDTGKFGYSTDFRDHSFNYKLPDDEWVHITLKTYFSRTELYVNGTKVDELSLSGTGALAASLIFPFERIGSKTTAFKGKIDNLVVYNEIKSDEINRIPHTNMTASVDSAQSGGEGKLAIDDDPSTIWHTKWDLSDSLPQSITLSFDQVYKIDKLTYLPRPTGNNGNITKYSVSVSSDGTNYQEVTTGVWVNNGDVKTAEFDAIDAKYIRLTAIEGVGGFASAAEINVYRLQETLDTEALINLITEAEAKNLSLYTPISVINLEFEIRFAKRTLTTALTQQEIDDAKLSLRTAIDNLIEMIDTSKLEEMIAQAEEIDTSIYTPESVSTFNQALESAKTVLSNATTQNEVDTSSQALSTAMSSLVPLDETLTLQTLVDPIGVSVTGYFHSGVTLNVTPYQDVQTVLDRLTDTSIIDNYDVHNFYDIHLQKDGGVYQPQGLVSVEMKVRTDIMNLYPEIIYVADNGDIEVLVTTKKEDSITFTTLHFSDYGIMTKKITNPSLPPTDQENEGDSSVVQGGTNTGDTTNVTGLLMIALLSLCGGICVVKHRNKYNRSESRE
jgi:hexosaminidase